MTRFTCQHCGKKFHYKEFYSKHKITCEYFSQSTRKKCSELDSHEILPSPQEMYQLVQHLHLQCEMLKDEIKKIKMNPAKISVHYLEDAVVPSTSYDDWIKLFVINYSHIKKIIDFDLTEGIKMCISQRIDSEGSNFVPIRGFLQKQKTLFICLKSSWEICTDEVFTQMIELIRHEITRFFCEWQLGQDIDTDTEMIYQRKITGSRINKSKQVNEIKTWMISKISR
jgi:hypothetical protein